MHLESSNFKILSVLQLEFQKDIWKMGIFLSKSKCYMHIQDKNLDFSVFNFLFQWCTQFSEWNHHFLQFYAKTQLLTHLQKQRSKCAKKKKEIIHLEPQKYLVFLSIISSSKFFLSHLLALRPLRLCPMLHSYLGLSQRRSVCVEV